MTTIDNAGAVKSFYVRRVRADGKVGWTGSIRSAKQAEKEATAWRENGWTAEVVPNTPETRATVRAWQKSNR